jgi:hypothetical protein
MSQSPTIPQAPDAYDRSKWQLILEAVRSLFQGVFRAGQDVRLQQGERLILKSPNGSLYAVKVDNAGALSTTAL